MGLLEGLRCATVRSSTPETIMAKVTIAELPDIPQSPMSAPLGTAQTAVTYTTTAQSAALKATTRCVRLCADAAFHLAIGANPSATANSPRYGANTEYFVPISGAGGAQKLAFYDGTS